MQQRSLPPTRDWRQVAPGSPATPNRHFNAALLRRGRSSWQAPPHPMKPPSAPPQTPEPSARPTASRRRGRRHAVLRRRAEAAQAASSSCNAGRLPHRPATPGRDEPPGEQIKKQTAPNTTRPSSDTTWTPELHRTHRLRPPNRLPARPLQGEVVGGMRCCGDVLKRRRRQAQEAER